jgi:proline iminopeptidase
MIRRIYALGMPVALCTLAFALEATMAATSSPADATAPSASAAYFDQSARTDLLSGGVRKIAVQTPRGVFNVWTKRVGNNPQIKVLLLHGGPGATHEYFEAADSYFPGAGVEYYYYDQLGSAFSDQPNEDSLWDLPRFVEEVEQVRQALGLDRENFYLLGHSWGGILGIEYALKYQSHLKGLIISNMMASVPLYNKYAHDVLMPDMDQKVLAEILQFEKAGDTENPRYMQLLESSYYTQHVLRMPPEQWPDPVLRAFAKLNRKVYVRMQGPSEMGIGELATLAKWDRGADLPKITVPTLVVGARYDTMDPKYMEWMSKQLPRGKYLYCPSGSHLAMYDDQQTWFSGVIGFLRTSR